MTITSKYANEDKSTCDIRLEPGDHLASLNVQASATIPAYTIPAHTRPAFTLDGVDYPAKDVPAEDVAEVQIPAGDPMTYSVPTRSDNPVWVEFLRRLDLGEVAEPEEWEAPPPGPIVVSKVDFYRRMTDEEAEAVEDEIARQPVRQRRIFESANTFRSDAPEWGTLEFLAKKLFTPERKAIILAPSE